MDNSKLTPFSRQILSQILLIIFVMVCVVLCIGSLFFQHQVKLESQLSEQLPQTKIALETANKNAQFLYALNNVGRYKLGDMLKKIIK